MGCEPKCRPQERIVIEGKGRESASAHTNLNRKMLTIDWLNPKCQLQQRIKNIQGEWNVISESKQPKIQSFLGGPGVESPTPTTHWNRLGNIARK